MSEESSSSALSPKRTIDIAGIRKAIPHRYPFLLVDRVDVMEEEKSAVGTKCVTINPDFDTSILRNIYFSSVFRYFDKSLCTYTLL